MEVQIVRFLQDRLSLELALNFGLNCSEFLANFIELGIQSLNARIGLQNLETLISRVFGKMLQKFASFGLKKNAKMQVYLNSQKRTRTVSTKFAEKVDEHIFYAQKDLF